MWKECDLLCLLSKNTYNLCNYTIRQAFIENGIVKKYGDLNKELKYTDAFKQLGSNSAQMVTRVLCNNWKSFLVTVKDYTLHPYKYTAKPKLPRYLKPNGRFLCTLTNMQTHIKDGYLYFAFKRLKPFNHMFKTNVIGNHLSTRIVPRGSHYVMEIVYQIEVPDTAEQSEKIASIELGVDNFITMVNNISLKPIVVKGGVIKSINQYYNKKKSALQSELMKVNKQHWSKKLQKLTDDRYEKIKYQMHCISKRVVDYCVMYGIDTLVVGRNKGWKQENEGMQNFTYIPYEMFENMLQYKCENNSIKCIFVNESYTSGTSFLDNEQPCKENYDKSRRVHRGLFVSNNGTKINADVNGAYQILRKVIPNAFANGIEGVYLHPTVIQMGNREWVNKTQ